jgi:hypothetical protein
MGKRISVRAFYELKTTGSFVHIDDILAGKYKPSDLTAESRHALHAVRIKLAAARGAKTPHLSLVVDKTPSLN